MLQGQQTQQPTQEVEPQPAPWTAPEEPQPAFTVDEGHVPLSKTLWEDAKESFTTGMGLLANLKTRSLNVENDLKQKFVGFLLSHRITRNIGVAAAAFIQPPEKFLTKEDYENSQYKRPGLNFEHGVYENLAKEETQFYDQNQIFQDLNARTDQGTWPAIAKGGAYLIGGFANPLFLEFGGMAGEVLAPAATFLTDFLPEIKALSPEAQAGVKAFVGKTIIRGGEMPVFTGMDYAEERAHQEDASIKNILYSIPAGMIFGAAEFGLGKVFGRSLSSRAPELKSDFAKDKGMNEPRVDEPEPIVQANAISPENHEEAFKSGVAQMENGKLPEVSEIIKQNYHDDWQDTLGDKLREDPEEYAKELDDLKKARDINEDKINTIDGELDRLREKKVSVQDKRWIDLTQDKVDLLAKKLDIDDMIDTRENAPEASNMEDLAAKVEKQHSAQSDFSHFEPKEPVELPEEARSKEEYANKMKEDFNAKKAEMSEKTKELANTEDVREKTKGTQKFLNAVVACLIRGA